MGESGVGRRERGIVRTVDEMRVGEGGHNKHDGIGSTISTTFLLMKEMRARAARV